MMELYTILALLLNYYYIEIRYYSADTKLHDYYFKNVELLLWVKA